MTTEDNKDAFSDIRRYYDDTYHRSSSPDRAVSGHLRRLTRKLRVAHGTRVLDIGCGVGDWLLAASELGAVPHGVDLSERAITICRVRMPHGKFIVGPAEHLQVPERTYDVVTCLGSLEHFAEPETVLRTMVRAVKEDGIVLLLVPNSGFLTRSLGLYRGTEQRHVREVVRSMSEWETLFEQCGLEIRRRWRDLHVLNWRWIVSKGYWWAPIRAVQALALPFWPLSWQYQVYYLCTTKH